MKQFTIALSLLLMLGYKSTDRHPFTICFRNTVGSQPLEFSTAVYTNRFGEPFTVEQFKYYVSAIRIADQQGNQELLQPEARLIDQADTTTLTLHGSCSLTHPSSIRFTIGVDSMTNTQGVMTGDLDPMHGMFWTWNSGYIYARLEGQSDSAKAPAHRFTWDIGGYKANANAARQILLNIPAGQQRRQPLTIQADIEKWFDGNKPIKLSQSPTCHEPGALAMQLADNYSTMFSIAP
jgi:hypothetical protein